MTIFPNHHIQLNQQYRGVDSYRGYKASVSEREEQDHQSTVQKWGDVDTFCNEYGFYQNTSAYEQIIGSESKITSLGLHQPPLPASNVGGSSYGNKGKEIISLPLSSIDFLKHDLAELKSCDREQASSGEEGTGMNPKLSTDQIMRLAGERFIEFASYMFININEHMHPYSSNLAGITVDDKLDIELVQLLFTVAEKVSHKQTDRACRLLANCQKLASNFGTPVQRAVFYFAEGLAKRIERETGKYVSNICEEKNYGDPTICSKLKHQGAVLAWYQKLPFPQAMQFAGVQAMLEKMKMNSKVHLIDIQMRIGATWVILMQALAKQKGYKVKQLKLTVIETIDKEAVEVACTQLKNFAKNLNLIFSYHIIVLPDMMDLTENQFEVESDEIVVAYAPFVLRRMIAIPLCLERLMNVMKRLNPSVMVITEVEAKHNSPSFVNRFIEAFFYLGALFDCLEDCMEGNDQDRMAIEAEIFGRGIHNIVATEGTERVTRSVKSDVWRAFFERFGIVEVDLSESSLFQAQLVLQTFSCVNSCSLEKKGKGLVVGWKGTPVSTLSAWRFS